MASESYPDGSTNGNWTRLKVILPKRDLDSAFKVRRDDVASVVCHRVSEQGHEQYLVKWKTATKSSPYSWHELGELSDCLPLVQEYIGSNPYPFPQLTALSGQSRKRRNDDEGEGSSTSTTRGNTPVKGVNSANYVNNSDTINGSLKRQNGIITMLPTPNCVDIEIPTYEMRLQAAACDTRQAQFDIRIAFDRKLPPQLEIINQYDHTRPPLDFQFIDKYKYGKGVEPTPTATIIGCGVVKSLAGPGSNTKLKCAPHMGQNIGCEYSRVCECLEFAAVDETRVGHAEQITANGDLGLPKRFPYHQTGKLQPFYLNSRHVIYECNPNCACGPNCKTRLVQHGRKIPLQIFKTRRRGWGLRSTVDILKGTFIDTYRGEIITDAEAEQREKSAVSGLKASYLYSLDKHVGDNGLTKEDCYVVDGEYEGGPTRFINHSCEPNVRQYTVSYNKYDLRIYDLAFFAYKDIKALEEFTFDYQDKDEEDSDSDEEGKEPENIDGATEMKCLCGSRNCRGTLWI